MNIAAKMWTRRIAVVTSALLLSICSSIQQSNAQSPASTSWSSDSERTSANAPASQVALEGELEILHEDFQNSGRYLYFLNTADGRHVALHFAKHPPTNLLTGDDVKVRGALSGETLMLPSGGSASVTPLTATTSSSTAPLPNTFGAQATLVILVNFQDAPTNYPYTVANARSVVFGTSSSFFLENSYQQTWLTGDVVGWYTIPLSNTTCDISSIASYAQLAATAAGVNLSAYNHYVYAFPQNNTCGFGGASDVGGSPSHSWINGNGMETHTVAHELGHAFGLWHSHLLDCGATATIGSNCTIWEYGDILDVMGAVQPAAPHYNAFQKERLGWLNYGTSPSVTAVSAPGTYVINPYELGGAGPNALKILKSTDPATGAKTWYYVESRQAVGFDAFLTNGSCGSCYTQNETNGVLVHIGTDGDGSSSDLLDMTPATPTYYFWFDPSLAIGQSFVDSTAGVILTTDWVTPTAAAVDVQFTGAVAVATNQPSYSPGQTVSTTATVTLAGAPVAKAVVSFTITKANGSVVTGSATTDRNGTALYKLRLTQSDPAGNYVAGGSTTINGNRRSGSRGFTVQ